MNAPTSIEKNVKNASLAVAFLASSAAARASQPYRTPLPSTVLTGQSTPEVPAMTILDPTAGELVTIELANCYPDRPADEIRPTRGVVIAT